MSRVVALLCSRRAPHLAALALISSGLAGCSADMSTRFSQNSFSNPFASQPEPTGSVPAPVVERRELPQYYRPQPAPIAAPQTRPVASTEEYPRRAGLPAYAMPVRPIETTGTVPPRSVAAARPRHQGPTTIIVGTSDTLDIVARRYNVSSAAILQANGYKGPRALSPGQQLIIPHHTAAATGAAPAVATPASKPIAAVTAAPTVHVVNRGDTLLSIARRNRVTAAELGKANGLDSSSKLKLGQKLTVPGAKTAAAAPAAQPVTVAAAQPGTLAPPVTRTIALGPQPQSARLAQATTKVED